MTEQPYNIACPVCLAKRGQKCFTHVVGMYVGKGQRTAPHPARVMAAERANPAKRFKERCQEECADEMRVQQERDDL